jgi:hypothetical protein
VLKEGKPDLIIHATSSFFKFNFSSNIRMYKE